MIFKGCICGNRDNFVEFLNSLVKETYALIHIQSHILKWGVSSYILCNCVSDCL